MCWKGVGDIDIRYSRTGSNDKNKWGQDNPPIY